MKTKKKNRFWTFCMACIPGAGQMYMGFMKMGLSMMLLFALTIMVATWMQLGAVACIAVVEWFYCFFHANHLASLNDEEFGQIEDEYLFGMDALPGIKEFVWKYPKWIAYGLILLGICFLWGTAADILRIVLPEEYRFIYRAMWRIGDFIPSILIGCGIIFMGVKLLSGKKTEVPLSKEVKEQAADQEMKEAGQEEEK